MVVTDQDALRRWFVNVGHIFHGMGSSESFDSPTTSSRGL